jgi:hypothetical protein
VRRGNWGEVGEDVGQVQYAVFESSGSEKNLKRIFILTTRQSGISLIRFIHNTFCFWLPPLLFYILLFTLK